MSSSIPESQAGLEQAMQYASDLHAKGLSMLEEAKTQQRLIQSLSMQGICRDLSLVVRPGGELAHVTINEPMATSRELADQFMAAYRAASAEATKQMQSSFSGIDFTDVTPADQISRIRVTVRPVEAEQPNQEEDDAPESLLPPDPEFDDFLEALADPDDLLGFAEHDYFQRYKPAGDPETWQAAFEEDIRQLSDDAPALAKAIEDITGQYSSREIRMTVNLGKQIQDVVFLAPFHDKDAEQASELIMQAYESACKHASQQLAEAFPQFAEQDFSLNFETET